MLPECKIKREGEIASVALFCTSTDFDLMPSHTSNDILNLLDETFFSLGIVGPLLGWETE